MNARSISLGIIFLLALLLAGLQQLAFEYFLYWRFWWYDVMMHFLGGTVLGSVFFWAVRFELPENLRQKYLTYHFFFIFVLALGIVWEIYEYNIGIDREYSRLYWAFDSAKDLVMDVLGGSVAYWVAKRFFTSNG